jgi:hypothetical protein
MTNITPHTISSDLEITHDETHTPAAHITLRSKYGDQEVWIDYNEIDATIAALKLAKSIEHHLDNCGRPVFSAVE